MKNKWIMTISVAVMVTVVVLSQVKERPHNRYYQHLEPLPEACTDHDDTVFCTHLPIVRITTDGPMPEPYLKDKNGNILILPNGRHYKNSEMVSATVQVYDSKKHNNHLTDVPVFKERALTRTRGNSSRKFDKKSYLLKFTEDNLIDGKKISLLGMVPDNNWALHGPFLDRTLVRNYVCSHLVGEIMPYSPDVRFCELFLNEEYLGVYLVTEKINYNKKGRINLAPTDPEVIDTSYLIKLDHGGQSSDRRILTFFDYSGKRGVLERGIEELEILYPNDTLTKQQKQKILFDLSCFEKAITSYDRDDPRKGYSAYIDVNSFVDYMVINEFFMNADAGSLSTYFCKDPRNKIQIIAWDFNNCFNNFYQDLSDPHGIYADDTIYANLLKNESFVDLVVARYHKLRKTTLSDEHVLSLIDETVSYLEPATKRNYERWGYCFNTSGKYIFPQRQTELGMVKPFSRNPKSYEEAVELLKSTVVEHGKYLDENIETLYARCHDSTNKQYKVDGGQ